MSFTPWPWKNESESETTPLDKAELNAAETALAVYAAGLVTAAETALTTFVAEQVAAPEATIAHTVTGDYELPDAKAIALLVEKDGTLTPPALSAAGKTKSILIRIERGSAGVVTFSEVNWSEGEAPAFSETPGGVNWVTLVSMNGKPWDGFAAEGVW